MGYGAAKHDIWTERCKDYAKGILNIWEEGQRLRGIYDNEATVTLPGDHTAFVSNTLASKAEFQAMVAVAEAFDAFVNNASVTTLDRMADLTPLTQNP